MNSEHNWTRITRAENIPPREGRSVTSDGIEDRDLQFERTAS